MFKANKKKYETDIIVVLQVSLLLNLNRFQKMVFHFDC